MSPDSTMSRRMQKKRPTIHHSQAIIYAAFKPKLSTPTKVLAISDGGNSSLATPGKESRVDGLEGGMKESTIQRPQALATKPHLGSDTTGADQASLKQALLYHASLALEKECLEDRLKESTSENARLTNTVELGEIHYKALEREQHNLVEKYTQSELANERLQDSAQQLEAALSTLKNEHYDLNARYDTVVSEQQEELQHVKDKGEQMTQILDAVLKFSECGMCMATMKPPVALECGHIFCRPCLKLWAKGRKAIMDEEGLSSRGVRYSCPTCRAHTKELRRIHGLGEILGVVSGYFEST